MIKILQLGMNNGLGGIETFIISYYRNIDRSKIQFDFVNTYPDDLCFQDEIERMGGKIYKVSSYYKHPFKYIKEVKKIIKENNYNIVHCNMNSAVMLYPLIAAKLAGVKVIIAHSHNSSSDKGFIKSVLHNINRHFIPLLANQYYACSEEAGKWFYSDKIIKGNRFKIIKNAIDTEKYKFNSEIRNKVRNELHISKDTFVVGHVGRFVPQKNHTQLIDIFDELHKINNNSILLLVGYGPLLENIKKKVEKMNLSDSVIFLGARSDVNELMMAMDVFVLPSLYEGLGIVLIEAQASGLPCVTTQNMPKIVELSKEFKRLSLETSLKEWAENILKYNNMNRIKDNDTSSFDIKNCSNELTRTYNSLHKIKICHFVNGMVNGGVEKVISNYFSNMENKNDYDLHIVTQGKSDSKCLEEFKRLDFTIHTVTKKSESLIRNYKDIRKILKDNQFDIVHCHMTTTNFFPLFYSKLSGVKVRISHSHLNIKNISFKEKIYILLTRCFSKIKFACGIGAANFLFGTCKNVKIINNAISLDKFQYDENIRRKLRKEMKIKNDEIVIGHIGRFTEQKNHDFIIELFKKLQEENNNYKLLLIGIGELENVIKEKVEKLNLSESVLFLGSRDDVNELMQMMDIFILPSLFEGFPVVCVEAQASGLKCFVADTIHKEVKVSDNITFLNLDINKWQKEIKNNINYKRSSQIEAITEKGYNIKKEANKLDKIYKKLLKR